MKKRFGRGSLISAATLVIILVLVARAMRSSPAPATATSPCPAHPTEPPTPPQCGPESKPSDTSIHLYIPDGQLRSNPLRVFVNRDVSMKNGPVLRFFSGHDLTSQDPRENDAQPFDYVAPGQSWTETIDGQETHQTGTSF